PLPGQRAARERGGQDAVVSKLPIRRTARLEERPAGPALAPGVQSRRTDGRLMKAMIATNRAAPAMDQTTGKVASPTCTARGSGRFRARARAMPTRAPMKPSAIDTRIPPWL